MKSLFIFVYVFLSSTLLVYAQSSIDVKEKIAQVYSLYNSGDYQSVIEELSLIQDNLKKYQSGKKNIEGFVYYWRALTYTKINEYPLAIENFEKAIDLDYQSESIFYEYGQALYVAEKLHSARYAFKQSAKNRYKIAVSMYYIGFISQQLKDYKKAVSFYTAIEKLPDEMKKDVIQASRMQIADIYLEKIKSERDQAYAVEFHIIPQYEKALAWDNSSSLAGEIKAKIEKLQRKFDLVLFQLRNGRQTARPPYFFKVNARVRSDSNVNRASKESAPDEVVSASANELGFFWRYTFYPNSSFSIAPELRGNFTRFNSDEAAIKANNSNSSTVALKTNYEHTYNEAPATLYFDIEYINNQDDSDQDDKIEDLTQSNDFTLSEELQLIKNNPSTFRLKLSNTNAQLEALQSTTTSFIYEQLYTAMSTTFYLYTSYAQARFPNADASDNDTLTARLDLIFPTFAGLFNPNIYYSVTNSDLINDDVRKATSLNLYGFSLNRPLSSKWYITLDYNMSKQTGEIDSDNFTNTSTSLNIDYIY